MTIAIVARMTTNSGREENRQIGSQQEGQEYVKGYAFLGNLEMLFGLYVGSFFVFSCSLLFVLFLEHFPGRQSTCFHDFFVNISEMNWCGLFLLDNIEIKCAII